MTRAFENEKWIQAQTTIRWLENCGPRYSDWIVTIDGKGIDGISGTCQGQDILLDEDQISWASWQICRQARLGDTVVIKVRCDKLAMGLL